MRIPRREEAERGKPLPVCEQSEKKVPQQPKAGRRPDAFVRALAALLVLALTAGCLGADAPETEAPREETETSDASMRPIVEQFTGTATGTPAQPYSEDFPVEVPRGAVGINGNLSWERPPVDAPLGLANTFELALVDPDGEVVDGGYTDVDGKIVVATIDPPRAGTWVYRVTSSAAVNTPFVVDSAVILIVPEDNTIVKSLELRTFYEVNLILEEGATFSFSYNSTDSINWDIHSHPPEGVKYWEEGSGTTGASSFTAPSRDVFSILWENAGALPVQLSFEVQGKFRTHSHSG